MSETYYAAQILETIRDVRNRTCDNRIVPYDAGTEQWLGQCFNRLRVAVGMLGGWDPKTGDSEPYQKFAEWIRCSEPGKDLENSVSALLRPETENMFSRLAGEMNPTLGEEAEQRGGVYDKLAGSIRQISTKSYYSFAAIEIFALGVVMPLVLAVSPWVLIPGAALFVSGLPFIGAGMVTFKYGTSASQAPKQGTTKYELLINARERGEEDLESVRSAYRKVSDRFVFAGAWFKLWVCVASGTALTVMAAMVSQ